MGEAPDHIVLVAERGGRRRARGRRPRARSPTSRRRRCRSTRRARSSSACASASRRSSGPAPTTSATRPPTARRPSSSSPSECDLVLVIGSRNSSNSNRLVEVAREHGAASHLIDNEPRGPARSGSTASAWSASPPGASAPEELVQRLVQFFRDRGTEDVQELEVVTRGRPLHAPQDDPPGARRA